MSIRYRRFTRASVDQLVDAPPTDAEAAPVLAVLTDLRTAAPIVPDSDGERLAVAAFRAAQPASPAPAPAAARRRRRLVRLAAKIAAVAVVITASSVAAATGDDAIPRLFVDGTHNPVPHGRPASSPSRPASTTSSRPVAPKTSSSGHPTTSTPAAPPDIVEACRAHQRTDPVKRAKDLDKPRYAALVAAAGGRDRVDVYCAALVPASSAPPAPPAPPPAPPKPQPTHPTHPHPKP